MRGARPYLPRHKPRSVYLDWPAGGREAKVWFPSPDPLWWIQVRLVRETNAGINEDVWRLYDGQAYQRQPGLPTTWTPYYSAPVFESGQWEVAILEAGQPDYVGGLHGDELLVNAQIISDGSDVRGATAYAGWVSEVALYQNSALNQCNAPAVPFAERYERCHISSDGIWLDQRIQWSGNWNLMNCYMAMCPVVRFAGTDQVTHTARRDPLYADEDVSAPGFPLVTSNTATRIQVFGDQVWTETRNWIWPRGANSLEWVSNAVQYNKVYFDRTGADAVVAGTDLWTRTHYTLRADGGP